MENVYIDLFEEQFYFCFHSGVKQTDNMNKKNTNGNGKTRRKKTKKRNK